MSVNYNRARFNLAQTRNEYKKLGYEWYWPMYWDEGVMFYPRWNPGFRNPNKTIMSYHIRMYKTWKYNRKNQWKD